MADSDRSLLPFSLLQFNIESMKYITRAAQRKNAVTENTVPTMDRYMPGMPDHPVLIWDVPGYGGAVII